MWVFKSDTDVHNLVIFVIFGALFTTPLHICNLQFTNIFLFDCKLWRYKPHDLVGIQLLRGQDEGGGGPKMSVFVQGGGGEGCH